MQNEEFLPAAAVSRPPCEEALTHEHLRKRAVQWLTNTKRCSVVLSEIVTGAYENPDAIGWSNGGSSSHLVECKVSRADFFRNKHKISSRTGNMVGHRRYFMVPEGLVKAADMEESPDYGLLYCPTGRNGNVRVIREATYREPRLADEIVMLVSALRRVRTREFLTINIMTDALEQGTPEGAPPQADPKA